VLEPQEYLPSPLDYVRETVALFEGSDGAEAGLSRGVPIVVLTTTGARTGSERKTPIIRVEHQGTYLAVASTAGGPKHPAWYHNLIAQPRVRLQDANVRIELRARELSGPERTSWWARAVGIWPDYAVYQTRTDRVIPLLALEPVNP
jgi:deazaflavin-dependent oxidoreductase (nitroreductase family)